MTPSNVEWELDPIAFKRTGRWRARQFYVRPGKLVDERPLSERKTCEWREGKPR